MPVKTHIDADTGFRTHTITGKVALHEVYETVEEVYARPDFDPGAPALWDLRKAEIDLPTEEARHLADFIGKLVGEGAGGKVAIVIPKDFEIGAARMYETILSSQSRKSMKVFRGMTEANIWLDEVD
jgi:hypothetical protein